MEGQKVETEIVAAPATTKKPDSTKTSEEKWGKVTMSQGFTMVPSILLQSQRRLDIKAVELAVLLHILEHWWKADDLPWPKKQTIAERLQVSEKTVQRATAKMEAQGLITRIDRFLANNNGRTSNAYDPAGLVARLHDIAEEVAKVKAESKEKKWKAQNVVPKTRKPKQKDAAR